MIDSATAVILAGGKSSRMGRDKALLPYRGKNLIDAPIAILSAIFSNVILSVREPDHYSAYVLPKIADHYPDIGPMGGILSVLESGYQRIFCVACDMPYLNERLITHLCSYENYDAVIPTWNGRAESLHALYTGSLIPSFEEAVKSKRYKLTDVLASANVRYVRNEEIQRFDSEGFSFKNVNTPPDYEKLED